MKSRALVAVLAWVVLTLASGCAPRPDEKKTGPVVIGFSIATDSFILERWNKDIKVFSGAAHDLGAEVIVQLSAGGTKEQLSQIDFLLTKNIDVLVVVAHDTEMFSGIVKKARDRNIPVVAYDRLIMGVPIDAYVSFNNREVGQRFGRALLDAVPQGRYLVVNGSTKDSNSFEVNAGLHEVLDPAVARGRVTIAQEIWLDEWSSDEALDKVGRYFDQQTNIAAIACANDQIASAAIQVLEEHRLAGKVAVVGQDADTGACQKIVEGTQLMTVYKPIGTLATRAAVVAIGLARGKRATPDRFIDNRSGQAVPFFVEPTQSVFRSNMDATIIRDGFHSSADVYRNTLDLGQK
jgi:D-xylose transport system substrate-binding protein